MGQRGQHPKDAALFARNQHEKLQQAATDLQWLLSHGYALTASLKLVGDRFQLRDRQRLAVGRATASVQQIAARQAKQQPASSLKNQVVWIDALNLLLTLEAFLGGGILLRCQDGTIRDMSSVHGTYRKVEQTQSVIETTLRWFYEDLQVESLRWLIDSPVSNSGRLQRVIQEVYAQHGNWRGVIDLAPNPDVLLRQTEQIVITSDSVILDQCQRWTNAAAEIIEANRLHRDPSCAAIEQTIVIEF